MRSRTSRSHRPTRRHFLRGACSAVLALPMLEIFTPPRAAAATAPPRLLVYFFPNGRRPAWWVPTATGGSLTFGPQSSALQPFADRCLSLVDLDNVAARSSPGAAHAMGTSTILTGTTIPDLAGLKNGISVDQVVAGALAPPSRFASLQWSAGEPGPCDIAGASCAYTQSVSWAGFGTPLMPTIDPKAAFDRMFASATDGLTGAAGETRKHAIGSVLDQVDGDAKALEARLGRDDKERLEEYFTALRALEKSLTTKEIACDVPAEGPGTPLPYPERVEAFHELIRLAFQCDQTRVLSFMIEFGLSCRSHDFLGAPGQHHALSHFTTGSEVARLKMVESWQASQLASLLGKLASTPGVDGASLLDETLVLAISSMGDGAYHVHEKNCPLLFGGGGVVACDGRQLVCSGTPLADLHVTLLQGFGVEGQFGSKGAIFGDHGTKPIAGVLV